MGGTRARGREPEGGEGEGEMKMSDRTGQGGVGGARLDYARHLAVGESPKGAANTSYMGKCDKGSAYTKLAAALLQRA